jgi:hypothetical protein
MGGRAPEVTDPRGRFVAGFFQDTLGPFLAETRLQERPEGKKLVVHLDADLYTSTLYVLTHLSATNVLRPGDVLLFDEFGVPMHEFKAFAEWAAAYRVRADVIGQANDWLQVTFRLA